ncbi:hypothetical protein [Paeniglutamicibacter sp.]|uniref:hypothetical protein n=1 Tax=Paeniglutamicibacter sp. TaxID=1934391 RepID=UPI00398A31D9
MSTETNSPKPTDPTDWKAEARKWEKRSKDNRNELEAMTGKVSDLETANSELTDKVASYETPAPEPEGGDPADDADADADGDLEPAAPIIEAPPEPPSAPIIEGQGNTPGPMREDPNRLAVRQLFGGR